jgi:hypothetical protein
MKDEPSCVSSTSPVRQAEGAAARRIYQEYVRLRAVYTGSAGVSRKNHIPSFLVVNRWAADGESGSHHDFRFRHDIWTRLFH